MLISPSYRVEDWKAIRDNLPLNKNNENWKEAIKIFDDRILGRFLKQIKYLEDSSDWEIKIYCGFTIMSLACLLIETLNQFREGKASTKSAGWIAFRDFFKHNTSFHDSFKPFNDAKDTSKSGVFYSQIRCGLLHQAETKAESKIRIDYEEMIAFVDDSTPAKGLLVNRVLFQEALVKAYEDYKEKLLKVTEQDLRKKFIKKMDLICRI